MGGKKKYIEMFGSFTEPFNSSFQKAEGLHLVDKPALKTISFDSMKSVKKLGMMCDNVATIFISFN